MRIIDLYNIREGISKMSDIVNIADINFAMSMAKLNDEVERELRIIDKGRKKVSDKYKEFLEEQSIVNMTYCIQKEDGTFQTMNGNLLIRTPIKYNAEIKELRSKYKEEIAVQEKNDIEFEEYLEQEFKGNITKIPKSLFPATTKVEHSKLLFSIIDY